MTAIDKIFKLVKMNLRSPLKGEFTLSTSYFFFPFSKERELFSQIIPCVNGRFKVSQKQGVTKYSCIPRIYINRIVLSQYENGSTIVRINPNSHFSLLLLLLEEQ